MLVIVGYAGAYNLSPSLTFGLDSSYLLVDASRGRSAFPASASGKPGDSRGFSSCRALDAGKPGGGTTGDSGIVQRSSCQAS